MSKARTWMERLSQKMQLPADITAGIPRMELIGSGSFSMEPHKGLLEYGQQRICIGSSIGPVAVTGEKLAVQLMNRQRITVVGSVHRVELVGHG